MNITSSAPPAAFTAYSSI